MTVFLGSCAVLFNDTFSAAMDVDFFAGLVYLMCLQVSFALFHLLRRGASRI